MYRTKHFIKKIRTGVSNQQPWSFELNYDLWADQFNTRRSEELSGIYKKIELLRNDGEVKIIGGINTEGSDELFFHEDGEHLFLAQLENLPQEGYLLIYSPHPFWANLFGDEYKWIPSWKDYYAIIDQNPKWRIHQYSPTFDSAGRYFFIAQKTRKKKSLTTTAQLSKKTFHVFYFQEGEDLKLSKSNMALSANLCSALSLLGAKVYAHDMNDSHALRDVHPDDILIGHVGKWVKIANEQGFSNIILFNPANRWYPTRNNSYFESNATIAEQVSIAKLVIAQSGAIWRTTSEVDSPNKWRWIDLGIDPHLFPKLKTRFNKAGKRKFLFFHLYDEAQKGADVAKEIIKSRPNYEFISINGDFPSYPNLHRYLKMSNTGKFFRKIIRDCDFILVPSHEDAQPGSFIEAASLGLIPVSSYSSGYSISFPKIVSPNNVENWIDILDKLQSIEEEKLVQAQNFIQHYNNVIHNWHEIKQMVLFYLREFL